MKTQGKITRIIVAEPHMVYVVGGNVDLFKHEIVQVSTNEKADFYIGYRVPRVAEIDEPVEVVRISAKVPMIIERF